MALFDSRLRLRSGIIINLVALGYILLGFTGNTFNTSRIGLIVSGIFALMVLMYTYYFSFWQNGLWKEMRIFRHRQVSNSQDYFKALRFAYAVFTMIILAFLIYWVITKTIPHYIPVIGFIYLAHILPGVYLGWKR